MVSDDYVLCIIEFKYEECRFLPDHVLLQIKVVCPCI